MPLLLEIVTPEKKVYSNMVDSVVLPTPLGEIGILPGHLPLLALLEPGELKVTVKGKLDLLAVDKGFIQVLGDKVSVLAEAAIDIEDIELPTAEEARARAEKALEDARKRGEEPAIIEELETKARFALAQSIAKARNH